MVGGRTVEEDDPDYLGKYRGSRLNDKSIHIDVDLWGWPPWLNRPLARTCIWLSDVKLRQFRCVMEWARKG